MDFGLTNNLKIKRLIYLLLAVRLLPFCGATGVPCFGLWLTPSVGFKTRVEAPCAQYGLCVMDTRRQLWPARGSNHNKKILQSKVQMDSFE